MRALFLNRAYRPDFEATAQVLAELTQDIARDHQVTVLCGQPYYAELDGRVFPFRDECRNRVDVRRVWGTRWPKSIPLARMLNHSSYFAMALLASPRLTRPDVVVSLTDPPFLGLLALRLKKRFSIPFVYYCQDLYPDVARAVDMAPRVLAALFERVQRRILDGADHVVALGQDMAERLVAGGVPEARVTVIHNWADTSTIVPHKERNSFRERLGADGKFVVMYSGNFGYVWDLDAVLQVAEDFKQDSRYVFVLIGDGSTRKSIERQVAGRALTNVRLLPYQPRERLAESLSAADLHVVPMKPGVYGTMVPSKLYGILAAGTPYVALAEPASEAARIVQAHGCGWVAAPGDAVSLSEIVREAAGDPARLARMGQQARFAAEAHYSRAGQTAKFAELLEAVVAEARGGSG